MDINFVTLSGGVGQDPVFYPYGDNRELCKFGLGNKQPVKEELVTSWYNCVAFDKALVRALHGVKKGSRLVVMGQLQTNSYENKEGVTIKSVQLVVQHVAPVLVSEESEAAEPLRRAVAPRTPRAKATPAAVAMEDDDAPQF